MKKAFTVFLSLILINVIFSPSNAQAQTTNLPSRAIHVVFDDSGSMIRTNNVFVDRWGQAKYAMEVFAAMLQERDTMRVYYMSDFDITFGGNINADPKITIFGSEPAETRVSRIHNTISAAANTPFDPVVKAHNDLISADADEKWLVILADGGFNQFNRITSGVTPRTIDVNGRLTRFASETDINIFFLVIGDDNDLLDMLRTLNQNPAIDYYVEHARNSDEILGKITDICNKIFNRNSLRDNILDFDIPILELLVFAQGPDVRINGIRGAGSFRPNETVNVRYSERAATNRNEPGIIISRELTGVIAAFQDIPKGFYTLDIAGAREVEIYFSPDVTLGVKLFDSRGREVRNRRNQDIQEGEYQVRFGFVNERGEFFESELLGTVNYTAIVRNDGQEIRIRNGDTVVLNPGELIIDVRAEFLDINTSESVHNRQVSRKLTAGERFCEWVKKYWWILAILAAILLWFLCYRVLKKRFPKDMALEPQISKKVGTASPIQNYDTGTFTINLWSRIIPVYPQTGIITVASDFGHSLPALEVKALGGELMELTNTPEFIRNSLKCEFYIDGMRTPQSFEENIKMDCYGETKTVVFDGGTRTTYTCHLRKSDD